MIVTNGRQITTKEQNDLGTLEKFMGELYDAWNKKQGLKGKKALKPENDRFGTPGNIRYNMPPGMDVNYVLDFGANFAAIGAEDIVERPSTTYTNARYQFTPEELSEGADRMATLIAEKQQVEAERKEIASSYKSKIDELDARIGKFANQRNIGYEMRDIECKELLNFKEQRKYFISVATGKIVREEGLKPDDMQLQIIFPEVHANGDTEGEGGF